MGVNLRREPMTRLRRCVYCGRPTSGNRHEGCDHDACPSNSDTSAFEVPGTKAPRILKRPRPR